MSPTPEYRTLHGRLSNNNRMTGVLGIGGGTANYENLINKPSINDITLVGNKNTEDLGLVAPSDLSEVAFSGDYDDLTDKPSIPSKTSDLTNDSGYITMEDMTASNVEYDNTASGISSDDVQSALDNIINAVKNALILDTVSGDTVTFTTDKTMNLYSLKANVTATQAGSGTPSPTNPRAISGYSSAVININSNTVTISFGNTYYGGIIDVTNGKLRVTKKYWEYDGSSDETWNIVSGTGKFYIAQQDVVDTYNPNKYSNIYPFSGSAMSSASVTVDKSFYTQRNETDIQYNRIWVYNSDYSTVEQFKTALSNQHLQIVADLIVPVVVDITPAQITAISGLNTVSVNCGSITELSYFKTVGGELS